MKPTPQTIIQRALELLAHRGWRKSIYTATNKDNKVTYHIHDMPCFMCGVRLSITGLSVQDALLQAFNSQAPLTFNHQDKETLHSALVKHELPLYETKCLITRIDYSILIRERSAPQEYLYPMYIDLREWNDRKDQTKEHIFHTLELASKLHS